MLKTLITSAAVVLTTTVAFAQDYDRSKYPYSRSDFGCKSPLDKVVDVHNGKAILCKFADLDHRVSTKSAFDAGIDMPMSETLSVRGQDAHQFFKAVKTENCYRGCHERHEAKLQSAGFM